MKNLSIIELKEINGGTFWDGVAVAVYYTYKYSSITAALVVGIAKGYLKGNTWSLKSNNNSIGLMKTIKNLLNNFKDEKSVELYVLLVLIILICYLSLANDAHDIGYEIGKALAK